MARPVIASSIVDVAAQVASIDEFWFLGAAGAVTITGFFVDAIGRRTGVSFSTPILAGSGTADPKQIVHAGSTGQTTIPADAVGAVVDISADVHFDLFAQAAGGFSTDFETNYARFPQIAAGNKIALARVA